MIEEELADTVCEFPLVQLKEIMLPIERQEITIPDKIYRQLGVQLWGEGAYERESIEGIQTKYKALSRVEAKDIVVNKIWARNGSVAVVPEHLSGCFVSGEFPTFKPIEDKLDPRWFHWLTRTKEFWRQCDEKSQGTSGKNRIRPERFLEIEIPLPSIEEQRRIVARIKELAARIEEARELRRRAVEEAEALVSTIISNLNFEDTCWSTVKNIVDNKKSAVRSGPFGSQLHHDEFVDSGVAAIGTRDVQVNRFILVSGWHITLDKFEKFKRYQVFPGDVLTTIVGASIGRFCVAPNDVPLAITTKHVMALTLNRNIAEPRFITYMLNFHTKCRKSIFSQTEGSAQPSLNAAKVLKSKIPLPSLSEQRHIVAYLDGMQSQLYALRRHQSETAAALDALLPAVLERAFRGEF